MSGTSCGFDLHLHMTNDFYHLFMFVEAIKGGGNESSKLKKNSDTSFYTESALISSGQ